LFENNLLFQLGYGYDLESDVHGDDIAQGAYYEYQSQSGFVRSDIGKISGNTIQRMLAKDILNRSILTPK
jgi:hypothetical protein